MTNLSDATGDTPPGTVFWITGLSGSGKTTIGNALVADLRSKHLPVVFFDGDSLREVCGNMYGHDRNQRLQASLFYARLCKSVAAQGIHVVCSTISLFHQTQAWNRAHIAHYLEIFVNVPLKELEKRDFKNIYPTENNAHYQHVVGLDITPEYPQQPDIKIDNYGDMTTAKAVSLITGVFDKPQRSTFL